MDKPFSGFQHPSERYSHGLGASFDNFSEEKCGGERIIFV
jgi:hypothetical protein